MRASDDGEVIYETETETQYAQVVEEPDGDRILQLNEGQAIHSLYKPGSYLTGRYWDGLIVMPFAALGHAPERVAILGNAAGTAARMYGHYFPDARVDGVEIDGELTEIGRRYFDLGGPNLHTYTDDARPWLRRSDGDYDVIVVDAYRQPYIPFYLATREFFELARDRLAPGGVVVVNVGHPEGNDDLEKAISATMADVFATVLRDPLEHSNTLLLGSDAPRLAGAAAGGDRDAAGRPQEPRGDRVAADRSDADAAAPSTRDDQAPVEWLIDKSILGYAEGRSESARRADVGSGLRGGCRRPVGQEGRRRPRTRDSGNHVIVDCAQYSNGVRQDVGPLDIETAAERAKHGDGFVWLGLHDPEPGRARPGRGRLRPARAGARGRLRASISARSSRTTRAPTSSSSRPRTTTTSARRSTSARSTCSSAAAT